MEATRLRSWWFNKQHLPLQACGQGPSDVLSSAGWARSVGGSNPYLTFFSRSGASRGEIDRAVADLEIHELPSARGCTYVLPASDFALGLTLAMALPSGDLQTAKKWLGVTEAEIEKLCNRVVETLGDEPMDPRAIREAVGDAARNLGEEGKKRGVTTTLPIALGRLQALGEIRRSPVNGRLDQQRYGYVRWHDSPLRVPMPAEEAFIALAQKFFRWIGPASVAQFQWFSGLSAKAANQALEPLGLVPIEEGSELLILRDELELLQSHRTPSQPQIALVGSIDSFLLLRRDLHSLLEPEDLDRKLKGDKAIYELRHLQDLTSHAILDRGRVIGLWEYDTDARDIVWQCWTESTEELLTAVADMERFIREELGDARSFSLDSPQSRKPRIDSLRQSLQPV